jgi:hypothetical protein
MGVLLINALKKAPNMRTPSRESLGCLTHDLERKPTKGSSERLTSIALPIANNRQIVINASLPKLVKNNSIGLMGLPLKE